MRLRKVNEDSKVEKVAIDMKELCEMLSCGRNTAYIIAEKAEAGIKIGNKKKLYNVRKIKEYIESITL